MTKKAIRHQSILEALDQNPVVRVSQLADMLEVSVETVRRDLKELEESGQINRTYGGAIQSQVFEPALAERLNKNVKERQAISRTCVDLIGGAESIFIGGGATTIHFAKTLRSITRNIIVITASYHAAMELAANPLIKIVSLPGLFDGTEAVVYGPDTLEAIAKYRADIAILGASGIDEGGISEAMIEAAQVYSAMIKAAHSIFVLADRSKFEKRALNLVSPWQNKMHLISDQKPKSKLMQVLDKASVKITTV